MNAKTIVLDEAEQTLSEYVTACWRHRRLILIASGGFALGVAVWSFLQTPVYQAKATVVIENLGPGLLDKDKSFYPDNSPEYFQTHFELMKSHYVLQRTARQLKLSERPEYQVKPSAIKRLLKVTLPESVQAFWMPTKNGEAGSVEEAEEGLIKQVAQDIEIMPIRGARLAHVTANAIEPELAAQIANTLVSIYIERNQELNANSKEQAAQWFTTHLGELRQKVQTSQEALYVFRAKHGLLTGEERKSVAAHTLAELNSQLVKTEMAKAEAQSRFHQIRSVLNGQGNGTGGLDWSKLDSQIQVLNSPLIQTLRAQEITVSSQVAELSEKYGPLHPKLTHTKAELQDLKQRIQQEVQKIYDSVKHQYDMALAQDRAVKEAITRYNADKIRLEQNDIEHSMLEREAESSQHLYDVFLKATKETDLSSGMRTNNVYLADPAVPSSIPSKPRIKLNIMLGILTGLMSGVGLAIFLEGRSKKLMAPADVERYIPNVSLLGVVPLLSKTAAEERALAQPNSLTPAAESFRIIRTSLLLSNPDVLPSRILITSPGENEGKTTLAVNLAMAMAQLEETRVILVDVDFRNQQIHPIYDVGTQADPPQGLAHLLRGEASLAEVVHDTFVTNLSVIPHGGRPSNPTELLHSKLMNQLLDWGLTNRYHIILDCPPVLPIADAAVLASKVDGVLLVVSAGETTREACRMAIQRIKQSGGRLLGVVMQKAPVSNLPYYYGAYKQQR
ncbi:MAG TPA: polysaccharide biosynthesis tyrosine autokinase [Nitrospira sp.]|nr:polysaccharide biosynthesis tyrosine autokinase [Nitrospira sp.]